MPFQTQGIDRSVIDAVSISILREPVPVDGFPSVNAGSFSQSFGAVGGIKIPMQFPPRITDDTKSANWKEIDEKSFEPIAAWFGASARKITMQFQYIVDGATFTTSNIANIAKLVKAYFYRGIQDGVAPPLVEIRFYNHVGPAEGATFRLADVNVTHGDTIIKDGGGVFPLLTTIKVGAWLYTNIGGKIEGKQDVPNAAPQPLKDWY